jgi:hypothetical protein
VGRNYCKGVKVIETEKTIVAISGGKDSTAMALRLQEVEPQANAIYLCTPTGNELPNMKKHWVNLEAKLGREIVRLQPYGDKDGLEHLIRKQNMIPNFRARWCTTTLKIFPAQHFLAENAPCVHCVGLRADEEERLGIYGDIPGVRHRFPLREWGWGLAEVLGYLEERGVCVPERTDCAWCYGQRIVEWKRLWEKHPDIYEQAVQLEKMIGHTFRSPQRDTWPAELSKLREEFASGRRVRGEDKPSQCRVCQL